MLKISLKNLLANKARLSLTGLAVVLGVGFVVASFIMSDGLSSSFGTLSREIYEGTDLVVRESDEFGTEAAVDESTLEVIKNVEGIRVAEGAVSDGDVQPVKADGTVVDNSGPPLIGSSWVNDPELNQLTLESGRAPGPGQFVIDVDGAAKHGFVVGNSYDVVTRHGTSNFELTGLTRFGKDNSLNGALITSYDIADARRILDIDEGVFDEVNISIDDGYTASEVEKSVGAALPAGLEVANQQTLQNEQEAEFNETINILRNVLLGFAVVSLFVSVFMIYNTFGIVVAQRTREIGLLRAIGAKGSQIRRSILVEAVIIGVVASAAGIALGIGLNFGIRRLFSALGVDLPTTELILATRTIVIALAVGIGATVVSSIAPALKASRVSPIAALSGNLGDDASGGPTRMAFGVLFGLAGLVLGAFGLQGGDVSTVVFLLGGGSMLVFFSVALLSPVIASQVVNIVAWPIAKTLGVSGVLARKNAGRHPRRTATTAAALMIGLSLITTSLVVGDSLKTQIGKTLETANKSDYLIADSQFREFSNSVEAKVAALPEIGATASVGYVEARIGNETTDFNTTELDAFSALFDLSVDAGSMSGATGPSVVFPTAKATELGYAVGDTFKLDFDTGKSETVTLIATFTDESLVDGAWLDSATVQRNAPDDQVEWMVAQVAPGSTAAEAEAAMATVAVSYPQLEVQSSAEYRETVEGEINQLLNIISAMLSLAILTALLGIGLTLSLAIVERTRELGLLRAVGMTRRQIRRMIRWEAAAIALFGAVLGVAVGLLFGWATVVALPDSFITTVSVPVTRLLIMIGIAGFAGLVAALLPARRAGRLDVLDAISTSQ